MRLTSPFSSAVSDQVETNKQSRVIRSINGDVSRTVPAPFLGFESRSSQSTHRLGLFMLSAPPSALLSTREEAVSEQIRIRFNHLILTRDMFTQLACIFNVDFGWL
jgi:hypothetical protein